MEKKHHIYIIISRQFITSTYGFPHFFLPIYRGPITPWDWPTLVFIMPRWGECLQEARCQLLSPCHGMFPSFFPAKIPNTKTHPTPGGFFFHGSVSFTGMGNNNNNNNNNNSHFLFGGPFFFSTKNCPNPRSERPRNVSCIISLLLWALDLTMMVPIFLMPPPLLATYIVRGLRFWSVFFFFRERSVTV